MANIPSQPPYLDSGNIRPDAKDETLEFYWGYPLAVGIGFPPPVDSFTISTYSTFGGAAPISYTLDPSTFYLKISSLMNNTQYAFLMTASNAYGISDPAYFRTVQPGLPPNPITNPTVNVIQNAAVQIEWIGPTPDVNIPSTGWFVVQSISSSPGDPEIRVNTYGFESTVVVSSLNTASMYSFNVYAVNDPGYSLAVSTLTISPTLLVGDIFTYIEMYTPDSGPNYLYRIYTTTNQWGVVQSPYTVNDDDGQYTSSNFETMYGYGGTSNTFFNIYLSRYANPSNNMSEYNFEFRNTNGSFLRTISTFTNAIGCNLPYSYGNSNTGFFYNSNDVTSNYDIQLYQPHTNIYQSSFLNNVSINSGHSLNNGVYFVTYDGFLYYHYIWNIQSNDPTLITSNSQRSILSIFGISTAIFMIGQSNSFYYNTVTYMDDTGFSSNYSLPDNTYQNIYINRYGASGNNIFVEAYNIINSNYDLYVFNQMPTMTPIILSNIQPNGYTFNTYYDTNDSSENYNQTFASDSLLILSMQGTSYFINNGIRAGYNDERLFYGGNYINIKITLEDSSTPIDISDVYYGSFVQRSNYGYFVGSIDAYPHTSLMYTTAGSNDINVTGQYNILYYNQSSNSLFSTFTGSYTCANGTYGTYWVRQSGSSVPSSEPAPFGIDLWYSVEHSNWGSAILTNTNNYSNDYGDYYYSNSVYGSNFILCKSLIGSISSISAQWEGTFLDDTTIVGFLESYVNDAPFCDDLNDFSTINLVAFDEWNVSTGYVYYSTLLTTNFPYTYDGDIEEPPLGKGTAYLMTGSNTTVVSTIFTSSNLLAVSLTTINSNGAGFIVQEQTNVTAHILTASSETSTILSTVEVFFPNYETESYNQDFYDLFYFNIISSNAPNTFSYILSNDGTLLSSNSSSSNIMTEFSRRNAFIYNSNTSNLDIIQNGVFTSTIYLPYGYDDNYDHMAYPYPDFANGELAVTSYDNDSNTIIITVTNDAITTLSTNLFTDNTDLILTQSFLMIWQIYPFNLLVRDMNTGDEYGYSTIGNTSNVNYLNQADSVCFTVYNSNPEPNNYIIFNFSTTTFSMQSDATGDLLNYILSTSPYAD